MTESDAVTRTVVLNDAGVDLLLTAVLKEAHRDLVKARRALKKDPGDVEAQTLRFDVEKFYRSEWFENIYAHQCHYRADPNRARKLDGVKTK